jgi:hypothetical protein
MALLTIPRMVGRNRFAQHIGRKRFAYAGHTQASSAGRLRFRSGKPAGV